MRRQFAALVVGGLAALLLPTAAVGAEPPPAFTPGASGVGDPYYPLDGNGGYDVQSYDLDLRYDPGTDVLTGTATITASATSTSSPIPRTAALQPPPRNRRSQAQSDTRGP